jgi:hypothetical protein
MRREGLSVSTFYDKYPTKAGANFIAVGWKEFGPGGYQVSVIYGRDDGEKEQLVTDRRDLVFDNVNDSEIAYKRECEAAKKQYPHVANASGEIFAELRKA